MSITLSLGATIAVLVYFVSPLGQALRAMKSNETRLEYIGVSARLVLLIGYVVSAASSAVGGVLLAALQGLASPSFSYWIQSGEFVFIAILGGAAYPVGALSVLLSLKACAFTRRLSPMIFGSLFSA